MPHPSLLWNKTLTESQSIEPVIPMQTMEDLILTGDFKKETLEILRKICTPEEISIRQPIVLRATENDGFRELLTEIRQKTRDLTRLTGYFDRSELEEERVLLFLPIMSKYMELTDTMTKLEQYPGKSKEIGRYFRHLQEQESFLSARCQGEELLSKRPSALSLTVNGSNVRAHEGKDSLQCKLEASFRRMNLPDAIPPEKHPTRATPAIVKGYGEVYRGFFKLARGYLHRYQSLFLEGEGNIRTLFPYEGETAFLLEIGAYFRHLTERGYPLCCPEVSAHREMVLHDLIDVSLAKRGIPGNEVIPNDVHMEDRGRERLNFFILSGANGGGKTTYLRACTLAALFFVTGCPVSAKSGRMMAFDHIFTHFPANESFESDGRFANETAHADEIMKNATENSFAVFNETFSGTDEQKSEEYSRRLAETMANRGTFGIYVTHIHALTGGTIPTLAAVIDENDENRRTYKIRRVGGTTTSFAADILEKYGLDAASLAQKRQKERKLCQID